MEQPFFDVEPDTTNAILVHVVPTDCMDTILQFTACNLTTSTVNWNAWVEFAGLNIANNETEPTNRAKRLNGQPLTTKQTVLVDCKWYCWPGSRIWVSAETVNAVTICATGFRVRVNPVDIALYRLSSDDPYTTRRI